MVFLGLKSQFARLKVVDGRQLMRRLGVAAIVFAVLFGCLLWKHIESFKAQRKLADSLPAIRAVLADANQQNLPGSVLDEAILKSVAALKREEGLVAGSSVLALLFVLAVAIFIVLPARDLIASQQRERWAASEMLASRNTELGFSEWEVASQKRILQFVLDHVSESVVVFSSTGALLLQNSAAKTLFQNVEHAADIDRWETGVELLDIDSSLALAADQMPVRVALKGGVFSPRLLEIRSSQRAEPHFVVVAGYPLLDKEGAVVAAIGSFHEVTESVQREIELRKAKSMAEDARKSKTEFLANMSHEIRTPMTTILGYADILLRPSISSQELRQYVETIRRNGQVLITLIDDILDVSRIESGRLHIEKTTVSLQEALLELHSLLASRAFEKKISFSILSEGKVPKKITTAPVRLRQILINLAGNAIKFTEKGGVTVLVRLEPGEVDGVHRLVFEVSDTGCGIAHHFIDSLFSPFVQVDTKANRLYGGSGLGLSLSRRLATALGGDVKLVSTQIGVGSRFLIEIDPGPVDPADLVEDIAVKDFSYPVLPTESSENGVLSGLKLLLVDDSTENLELFAYFLQAAGADVTKASDGQSALECALKNTFDLILLDIQMPRMDGYQTITKLRGLNYQGPVVALTAHPVQSEAIICQTAGFDAVLNKPIEVATLVEGVKKVVDKFQVKPAAPLLPIRSPSAKNSEKVRSIIALFVRNIPFEVKSIKTACEVQNWDEVVKNTHRFRGTAGSCGFLDLMTEISELEDAVLAGNTDKEFISQQIDRVEAVGASSAREFAMNKAVEQ